MRKQTLYSLDTLVLILACIALNLLLSRLMLRFEIPLFLDSAGTILAAALGGYLPGIFVGFAYNYLIGFSDPITLYYGIISILIALTATALARRGAFRRLGKTLLAGLVFALLGGGLGSVLTWLLYGFGFGTGISAPFAIALNESTHLGEFLSQFAADMGIDLADKAITVLLVFALLRCCPDALLLRFPNGACQTRAAQTPPPKRRARGARRRHSLRQKITVVIVCSTALLTIIAVSIGFSVYTNVMNERYRQAAQSAVALIAKTVDPNAIDAYLAGDNEEAYRATARALTSIRDAMPEISYVYVYQIRPDGCHVVFDLDTADMLGDPLGAVIPFDPDFLSVIPDLLAGKTVPPIVAKGQYGWLLTQYQPLYDDTGRCTAYAAADIDMARVLADRSIYVIRIASLMFGASVLLLALVLWYTERMLTDPLNALAAATGHFAYDSEARRLQNTQYLIELNIQTGDEIENLYHAITKTTTDVADYLRKLHEITAETERQARDIAQLQDNMILSFAALAENRNEETGDHIRRTAAYVQRIARQMLREGDYPDVLTPDYIEKIEKSAPLHDIGKICIPDQILGKPGRLTALEFEQMKTHTLAGRRILAEVFAGVDNANRLGAAMDMATYHHERWDGAGYPEGLSGVAIPLSARIMAVADVYDALVNKRCYKEALPVDQALAIIRQSSGTHFDPLVVAAFLRIDPALRDAPYEDEA